MDLKKKKSYDPDICIVFVHGLPYTEIHKGAHLK